MLASDLKKAQELSKSLKGLGYKPKVISKPSKPKDMSFLTRWGGPKVVKKTLPVRTPFKFEYDAAKVKDGKTPVKGQDYFTEKDIRDMVSEVLNQIDIPEVPEIELTPEMVKKIVQMMHSLPENDKLEVSKGIRNFQSFVYKGTRYGMEEMMHGGSSSTSTGGTVYYTPTGTVDSINNVFGVTSQPTSVVSDGITYFQGAGYSYAAGNITLDIPPSQYVKYTL